MDQHPIQVGVEILLVSSSYRKQDKLQHDGPLVCRLNLSSLCGRVTILFYNHYEVAVSTCYLLCHLNLFLLNLSSCRSSFFFQYFSSFRMPEDLPRKNDFVIWLKMSDSQIQIYSDFLGLERVKEVYVVYYIWVLNYRYICIISKNKTSFRVCHYV